MVEEKTQSSEYSEGKTLSMSSDTIRDVLTSQELDEAFARNLKEFREAKHFKSPNALAKTITKMSANTIRAWERLHFPAKTRGKRTYPRLDALERVAERLNVDIWELFHPDIKQWREDKEELERYRDVVRKKGE